MKNYPLLKKIISCVLYFLLASTLAYIVVLRQEPGLIQGESAPLAEQIKLMNNTTTTFRRLLNYPMVVNFWATWCPPCQKELPVFSKLAKKYKNNIVFVGAAIDSDSSDIKTVIKNFALDYAIGVVDQKTINKWQAHTLPTTYLLDKQGKIVWSKTGPVSEESLDSAIQMLIKSSK